MSANRKDSSGPSAGCLVTVAFLKARLDKGDDHLGMFMPLVLDAIGRSGLKSFATEDVQEALATQHSVVMPKETVATLLKRAIHKHYLTREAGRFRLNPSRPIPDIGVEQSKREIRQDLDRLGEALLSHATTRGLRVDSIDAALDLLFRFLGSEQVSLLLEKPSCNISRGDIGRREQTVLADFLQTVLQDVDDNRRVLQGILEGLVLYNAAFLPGLTDAVRKFKDLRVAFDSGLVRQALGYEGVAARVLLRETLDLLKANGIQCLVFDKTAQEIRQILGMYESKLGTTAGRKTLWPTPMTRHFIGKRYSPSDIRELSALLERDIASAGFQVVRTPRRKRQYTADEKALAARLARPDADDQFEPRVMHDVDCVAAALTMRKGHRTSRLENARAVFATSSSTVIKSTRLWWEEDEGETSVAPIVNVRALTSLAWLKKPAICPEFKVHELVALCAAALRPSPEVWRQFLKHLKDLEESDRITSDEEAAVVISAMSDNLLVEAEMGEDDPRDVDATTMDEIIERVRDHYRSEADEKVRSAIKQKEEAEQKLAKEMRSRELRVEAKAGKWAKWISRSIEWPIAALLLVGALALVFGHPVETGIIGRLVGLGVGVFVVLELVSILGHVARRRALIETWLRAKLRARFRRSWSLD